MFTGYPLSRGSIHITGPSFADKPAFKTGFFTDSEGVDIKKHVWIYKKQREIFRRMETFRGELAIMHPAFPSTSNAALTKTDGPLTDVKDIVYSAEDDKIIEEHVRNRVETAWHSIGTCRIGSREEGGVVDANLNVHGVKGLKVVDLSIPPLNVAANTMNTAVTVAEKGADIIIKELGLKAADLSHCINGKTCLCMRSPFEGDLGVEWIVKIRASEQKNKNEVPIMTIHRD